MAENLSSGQGLFRTVVPLVIIIIIIIIIIIGVVHLSYAGSQYWHFLS